MSALNDIDPKTPLTDEQYVTVRAHFDECPLPPDAGCVPCWAAELERRRRCHGSDVSCARLPCGPARRKAISEGRG